MARLCAARLLVALVPPRYWWDRLGYSAEDFEPARDLPAYGLAGRVERASRRLPVHMKCLPRAMALSSLLRGRRIEHTVIIAIRPHQMRDEGEPLHAWVEKDNEVLIGDLPGPWHVIHRSAG